MHNKFNNLSLIEGGASKKKIYRVNKKNINFIILDFSKDKNEFNNHLEIYNILKNINISIPEIFEVSFTDKIIVTEDFGNQRFDKVINQYDINCLLKIKIRTNSKKKSLITFNITGNYISFKGT